MEWLKWFGSLSDGKSIQIKISILSISVVYNFLDFCTSVSSPFFTSGINYMYHFCHCRSRYHFSFWTSSPVSTSSSFFYPLCSVHADFCLSGLLFLPMTSILCKLSHLSCFSCVTRNLLSDNRTSCLLLFSSSIISIYFYKSVFHTDSELSELIFFFE